MEAADGISAAAAADGNWAEAVDTAAVAADGNWAEAADTAAAAAEVRHF